MAKKRNSAANGSAGRSNGGRSKGRTVEIRPVSERNGHSNGNGASGSPQSTATDISFISPKDLRLGGRSFRAGEVIPANYAARYSRALARGESHADPAWGSTVSPPNMGRMVFPHVFTFQSRQSLFSKTYRNPDQALANNSEMAHAMRNDCLVMECLEGRQRGTALLDWHLETEDKKNPQHKQLIEELTRMIASIPQFTKYRQNLLEALWFGRTAIQHKFGFEHREGKRFTTVKDWLPINGDKLVFRYDDNTGLYDPDQIGIKTNFQHPKEDRVAGARQIAMTDQGPVYFLEPWERRMLAVHKHIIEDGSYENIMSAGRIHGVGIRDRIYWTWIQMQETLAMLMELVERTGNGFTIYYFQYGNKESEDKVASIARNHGSNNVILMPRMSGDPSMDPYGIEQIPPNTAGIDVMRDLVDKFFSHRIKRYMLGQTLTTEASATGLGSGVADLHLESFIQIIKYDSRNLEETITRETVQPIKEFNPEFNWARDIPVFFRIDTESSEPEKKLAACKQAWDMGARLPATAIMELLGLPMPTEEDEILQNPQLMAPDPMMAGMGGAGMGGAMGGAGAMDSQGMDEEGGDDGFGEESDDGADAEDFDPQNLEHLFGPALKAAGGSKRAKFTRSKNGRLLARYKIQHAPQGGATIAGKRYPGGEFIPDEALAQASPEELAKLRGGARQEKREAGMQKAGLFDAATAPSLAGSFKLAKEALPDAPKIVRGAMVTLHRLTETQRDGLIHTDRFDQNAARTIFNWFGKQNQGGSDGLPKQIGPGTYTYSSPDGRTHGVSGAFGAMLVTKGADGRYSMTYTHNTLAVKSGGAGGAANDAQNFDLNREGDSDPELGADEMQVEGDDSNSQGDGQNADDDYGDELDENDMRTWEFDADKDESEVDTELEDGGEEDPRDADRRRLAAKSDLKDSPSREPGDEDDEDAEGDPSGFGPQPKTGGPTAKAKPLNKRSEIGKAIAAAAEEHAVDENDLNEAVEHVWNMHRERLESREAAKSAVRQWWGVTQRDINRLENQGKDWTAIKGFDTIARAAATEYPELGIGKGRRDFGDGSDKEDDGLEEALWNALKEGKVKPPTRMEVVGEAAEWLAAGHGLPKEQQEELESVPFKKRIEEMFIARYGGQRRLFGDMGSTGGRQKGFSFEDSSPMTDAAGHLHAPKGGATVNGKDFEGGEYIPPGDVAAATEEEKQDLKGKQVEAIAESMRKAKDSNAEGDRNEWTPDFLSAMKDKEEMEGKLAEASAVLRAFPREKNGLTPDSVKATAEYRDAKRASDAAFSRLQKFNQQFIATHGKEYRRFTEAKKGQRETASESKIGGGGSSTNLFGDEVREKPKPATFENNKTRQPKMFSGMDSLPGQMDLIDDLDKVNDDRDEADDPAPSSSGDKAPHLMHPNEFAKSSAIHKELRDSYFNGQTPKYPGRGSRQVPAEVTQHPLGTWRIDDDFKGIHGHDIEQLREFDPDDLDVSENMVEKNEEGRGWDAERYADWLKQGHQPPPIHVVETDAGGLRVTDGHRRLAAAKMAGKKVRAWVSPSVNVPGAFTPDGKPIKTGLTHELAIQQAIENGEKVPDEILKEYPEAHKAAVRRGEPKERQVGMFDDKEQ